MERIPRQHRPYELKEYDPQWKESFFDYAGRLKPIIGDNLLEIEHMGSTSIEGMVAKPQIDILVIVKDLRLIKDNYEQFRAAGFVPRGTEYVGIGDEYVTLDAPDGKRVASIHIFQKGHPAIEEDRLFREYISTHDEDKHLYIETKRKLYAQHSDNYEGYDLGKKEVIDVIKDRARKWAASKNSKSK
ncbi:MAG: hypothetical protein A3C07_05125 [Candidatus Sungbacteria bacterium RIFCSPHIGHO2_02_FULL_47_11]|uniref:GrpB family protein n=1 Tax=Candidatus Sungbacteria bacterium RIFCSPHIGHO2_02_FULL_47_11 TaxID=1802270 RepID=A0A1G2KNG5_9BACT|nr:MAG: hypothetical protein A3C07_05125 [Candidatus Sungbacteria bacterium RIFCSPHIGHO2_02_FULL_47_11]